MRKMKTPGSTRVDTDLARALDGPDPAAEAMRVRVAERLFKERRPPPRLGRFEISRVLGWGGIGIVYEARDPTLGRLVALKVLLDSSGLGGQQRRHILREANALARLSHPNVVGIYEVGEHESTVFIAMEHVEGTTFEERQRSNPLPNREVLDLYLQAGAGLAAAHAKGVVHRDFKPSNVLIGSDGRARVADFGLASGIRLEPTDDGTPSDFSTVKDGISIATMRRVGTPRYMSPEQLAGCAADERSDQFSFCVALYEAVFGVFPYPIQALKRAGSEHPPLRIAAPVRTGPRWLAKLLARGLSIAPEDRFESMEVILDRIRETPRRRRRWILSGAAVGFAGLAAAAIASTQRAVACPDASVLIAAGWNPLRRAAVIEVIGTGDQPYARDVARSVAEGFDLYASSWADARQAACEATLANEPPEPHETKAIMHCLDRARSRFYATIDFLEDARKTDAVLHRAEQLLAQLGAPHRCFPVMEPTRVDLPTPELIKLEQDLDRAALLRAAAAYGPSIEAARLVADEAHRSDAGRLQAEALLEVARAQAEIAGADEASASFFDALALAQRHDEIDAAAQAWTGLAMIAARAQEDPVRARQCLKMAEATVERLGSPTDRLVEVEAARGELALLEGDTSAAVQAFGAAVARLETAPQIAEVVLASALTRLANAHAQAGDLGQSSAVYERAITIRRMHLGRDHPDAAAVEFNLALNSISAGDLEQAESLLTHVATVESRAFGPESVQLARTLVAMGVVAHANAEFDVALERAQRAATIQRAKLPATHSERASGLSLCATVELDSGDYVASLHSHLDLLAEMSAGAPVDAFTIHNNIAWLSEATGRQDAAEEHALAALRAVGDEDQRRAYALVTLGAISIERGEATRAVTHLESALAITELIDPLSDPALLPEIRWRLAVALHDARAARARVVQVARAALEDVAATRRSAEAERELRAILRDQPEPPRPPR